MAESKDQAESSERQKPLRGQVIWRLPIEQIQTISNFNPRSAKNTNDVDDLMEYMKSPKNRRNLPPIRVVERQGTYFLTQGHRRLKAARKLNEEGVNVPYLLGVIEADADEFHLLAAAIAENQGLPLTPMEEAKAFRKMLDKGGWSVAELAQHVGKSGQHVYNRLHLLRSGPSVQKALDEGAIAVKDAVDIVKRADRTGVRQGQALRVHRSVKVDRRKLRQHRQTEENEIRSTLLPLVDTHGYEKVLQVLESIPEFLADRDLAAGQAPVLVE